MKKEFWPVFVLLVFGYFAGSYNIMYLSLVYLCVAYIDKVKHTKKLKCKVINTIYAIVYIYIIYAVISDFSGSLIS